MPARSILPSSHAHKAIFVRKAAPAVPSGAWDYTPYTTCRSIVSAICARVVYVLSSHIPNNSKNNKSNRELGSFPALGCLKKNGSLGG